MHDMGLRRLTTRKHLNAAYLNRWIERQGLLTTETEFRPSQYSLVYDIFQLRTFTIEEIEL